MGYRSDVVIAIEFEKREQLVSFVAFMRMNTTPAMQFVLNDMVSIPDTNIIALMQTGVKWYGTYEYIQAAEHLHNLARERGASTLRIILGERYDDTTYDEHIPSFSTLHDYFDLERYIRFSAKTNPLLSNLNKTVE